MSETKCSCGCGCGCGAKETAHCDIPTDADKTLDKLAIGSTATIVKILPKMRGRKKFADVGIVPGTELVMEAHAPFGGLIRVKVMETSMALHRDDATNIVIKESAEK